MLKGLKIANKADIVSHNLVQTAEVHYKDKNSQYNNNDYKEESQESKESENEEEDLGIP